MNLKVSASATLLAGLALALFAQNTSAKIPETGNLEVEKLRLEAVHEYERGNYKESLEIFEEAAKKGLSNDWQKVQIDLGMGDCYRNVGRLKDAETTLREGIELCEKDDQKGMSRRITATNYGAAVLLPYFYNNLGATYETQGRFSEAESAYKKSEALGLAIGGPKCQDVVLPLNHLIQLYLLWGKKSDAIAALERTKELEAKAPKGNPGKWLVYTIYSDGKVAELGGDYPYAEKHYQGAIAGVEATLGRSHDYCAEVLVPLGDLYRSEGRFKESQRALNRAKEIRQDKFSKNSYQYGRTLLPLAKLARDEGKYSEASELTEQATRTIEETLGPESLEMPRCWITTASILRWQGKYEQAEEFARKALKLDQKLLMPDHPSIIEDMVALSDILTDEGRLKESTEELNEALKLTESKLGDEHPLRLSINYSLAHLYASQNEPAKSEAYFKKANEVATKTMGPENARLAQGLRELADVYVSDKKLDEAAASLKQVLAIDEKLSGEKSAAVASDLDAL
ncbi:MAG TPA: tetratricopeptide repeat protein, partial [Chroococcales cyanobacterium]